LGCTSVICTDKTGTLTTNEMTAVTLCLFQHHEAVVGNNNNSEASDWLLGECEVEGSGYTPIGHVKAAGVEQTSLFREVAEVCTLCNEAALFMKEGVHSCSGEPTEAALLVLAEKLGQV
jgi:P-type Ca2+ transporter type 2C